MQDGTMVYGQLQGLQSGLQANQLQQQGVQGMQGMQAGVGGVHSRLFGPQTQQAAGAGVTGPAATGVPMQNMHSLQQGPGVSSATNTVGKNSQVTAAPGTSISGMLADFSRALGEYIFHTFLLSM